jgi:hypothetical protein
VSGGGSPGCQCNHPVINMQGVCLICSKERVHIKAKVPPFTSTYVPPSEAA